MSRAEDAPGVGARRVQREERLQETMETRGGLRIQEVLGDTGKEFVKALAS